MPFGPCDCCGAERHVNRMTFAGELFGFYCGDCFDLYPDHDEPGGRHDIHSAPPGQELGDAVRESDLSRRGAGLRGPV
mgnify:CR=1 FL=1